MTEATSGAAPWERLQAEAVTIVSAAGDAGVTLRVVGSAGIRLHCPGPGRVMDRLDRPAKDIDFIVPQQHRKGMRRFLEARGYVIDRDLLIAMEGRRYSFTHPGHGTEVDVFVERLEFCHTIEVAGRLDAHPVTIGLEELLLQKLQIIEMTTTDVIDVGALLATHDVSERRRRPGGDRRRPHRPAARPRLGLSPHRHPQPAAGPRPRREPRHRLRPGSELPGPRAVRPAARRDRRRAQERAVAGPGPDRRAQAVVAGRRRQGGDLLMGLRRRKPPPPRSDGERTIFFASDLHGSRVCFRKFVAAAKFYGADTLLLGGDISAKIVVPIVSTGPGRYAAQFHGQEEKIDDSTIDEFEQRAANSGLYTERMEPDEYQHYVDHPDQVEDLFVRVMRRTVQQWVEYAKTRLTDSPVIIYNAPGNDDPAEVDEVLLTHGDDRVRFVEGQIIELAPGMEMLSTGYTNVTPWDTHREYSEDEIRAHLRQMTGRLEHPERAIFNIHVPPYNSRLDTAPLIGQDLRVKTSAGAQVTAPVGSVAVREAIEEVQPLLGLHGHIHESGGSVKIGRTTAINVGSEYGEGVLRGVLLTIGDGKLLRYQAVTG